MIKVEVSGVYGKKRENCRQRLKQTWCWLSLENYEGWNQAIPREFESVGVKKAVNQRDPQIKVKISQK